MNFSFSLGEKTYIIRNEQELALVFELIMNSPHAFTLHRHIIMTLDADLMQIVLTYKGLLHCLKYLDNKNRFLLLFKLGDTLSLIIRKSEYLGNIFAGIPEEGDKIRIVKSMRAKGLLHIIHTPDDLGNILEWIFGDGEKLIFDMLGKDFLRSVFSYGTDIYKVFHFLADQNKDILADMLELSFIKSLVYTADDFFYVLKALSNAKVREFIPLFTGEEIRGIIGKNHILHTYLPKITKEKEAMLLQYINI